MLEFLQICVQNRNKILWEKYIYIYRAFNQLYFSRNHEVTFNLRLFPKNGRILVRQIDLLFSLVVDLLFFLLTYTFSHFCFIIYEKSHTNERYFRDYNVIQSRPERTEEKFEDDR